MDIPLLTTKLYIPPVRADLVPRPRLIERLDTGLRRGHRLTLVSASITCRTTSTSSSPPAPVRRCRWRDCAGVAT